MNPKTYLNAMLLAQSHIRRVEGTWGKDSEWRKYVDYEARALRRLNTKLDQLETSRQWARLWKMEAKSLLGLIWFQSEVIPLIAQLNHIRPDRKTVAPHGPQIKGAPKVA